LDVKIEVIQLSQTQLIDVRNDYQESGRGDLNTQLKALLYKDIKFIQLDDTITDTIK